MKYLIYGVAIITSLSGCHHGDRFYTISDPTKSETIILTKLPEQGSIYGWALEGSGAIEGEAEISLMLDSKPYRTEQLSGTIDFQWKGDWYADEAEILYTPNSVIGGSVQLKYRFHD